jgi:hypothetical protein
MPSDGNAPDAPRGFLQPGSPVRSFAPEAAECRHEAKSTGEAAKAAAIDLQKFCK